MARPMRIYADTSVFGGAVEPEFSHLSEFFFGRVREGSVQLVVSAVVVDELEGAPEAVQFFFDEFTPYIERVDIG